MKVTYDAEADVLHIVLSDVFVEESDERNPGVIFDYDHAGNLVGVEILDASRRVLDPRTMEYEIIEGKREDPAPAKPETSTEPDWIDEVFADGRAIDQAMKDAVQEALWRHKRLGQSIVVWLDGKVVTIPPEEIIVDAPPPPLKGHNGAIVSNDT